LSEKMSVSRKTSGMKPGNGNAEYSTDAGNDMRLTMRDEAHQVSWHRMQRGMIRLKWKRGGRKSRST
jgi:hypothetical protein